MDVLEFSFFGEFDDFCCNFLDSGFVSDFDVDFFEPVVTLRVLENVFFFEALFELFVEVEPSLADFIALREPTGRDGDCNKNYELKLGKFGTSGTI